MQHLEAEGDPDMLQLLTFLRGDKFRAIAAWMWQDPGYVEVRLLIWQHPAKLYKYLRSNGVDMDSIFSWISAQLGLDFQPPARRSAK